MSLVKNRHTANNSPSIYGHVNHKYSATKMDIDGR